MTYSLTGRVHIGSALVALALGGLIAGMRGASARAMSSSRRET